MHTNTSQIQTDGLNIDETKKLSELLLFLINKSQTNAEVVIILQ